MVAEAFLMRRGAMTMASLLLTALCSVSLAAASTLPSDGMVAGLNQKSLDFTSGRLRHRSLLQAPVPSTAPPPAPTPGADASVPAPRAPPSPSPKARASPPSQAKVYLMWVGIGAFILVLASVSVFCLCRKFGENKIRRAQRLPPLPRYH